MRVQFTLLDEKNGLFRCNYTNTPSGEYVPAKMLDDALAAQALAELKLRNFKFRMETIEKMRVFLGRSL